MRQNRMHLQETDRRVLDSLAAIRAEIQKSPFSVERLRLRVLEVLEFLSSPGGRTDANCRAVDFALMNENELWERFESIETADPVLADVLRDMSGALHDTVSAPEIARNFESTPEQLLTRLRMSDSR